MGEPVRKRYKAEKPKCCEHGCRKKAVFASGRCGPCEDAHTKRDFAVLDSYLAEMSWHEAQP